jgi:prolyl-tRNA synthetase
MECVYLDAQGQQQLVVMGCYGIGVSRMAAACVEQSHDDKGIVWAPQIAPYHAHLIGLNLEDATVASRCEEIYAELQRQGVEVLYDDRPCRAGEKFSDADLMGMPVRLTVSKRTLEQGKIEYNRRSQAEAERMTVEQVIAEIKGLVMPIGD